MGVITDELMYVNKKIGVVREANGMVIQGVTPLLQNDFGGSSDGDCVITSMTTCLSYLTKKDPKVVYKTIVDNISPRWAFNPNLYGTIPFFNTAIVKSAMAALGRTGSTTWVKTCFLKDKGYNFSTIEDSIASNKPVILSFLSANEGYYKYHGVTIIGCHTYKSHSNKIARMLVIYDNWTQKERYIDYDTISQLSCITYIY